MSCWEKEGCCGVLVGTGGGVPGLVVMEVAEVRWRWWKTLAMMPPPPPLLLLLR